MEQNPNGQNTIRAFSPFVVADFESYPNPFHTTEDTQGTSSAFELCRHHAGHDLVLIVWSVCICTEEGVGMVSTTGTLFVRLDSSPDALAAWAIKLSLHKYLQDVEEALNFPRGDYSNAEYKMLAKLSGDQKYITPLEYKAHCSDSLIYATFTMTSRTCARSVPTNRDTRTIRLGFDVTNRPHQSGYKDFQVDHKQLVEALTNVTGQADKTIKAKIRALVFGPTMRFPNAMAPRLVATSPGGKRYFFVNDAHMDNNKCAQRHGETDAYVLAFMGANSIMSVDTALQAVATDQNQLIGTGSRRNLTVGDMVRKLETTTDVAVLDAIDTYGHRAREIEGGRAAAAILPLTFQFAILYETIGTRYIMEKSTTRTMQLSDGTFMHYEIDAAKIAPDVYLTDPSLAVRCCAGFAAGNPSVPGWAAAGLMVDATMYLFNTETAKRAHVATHPGTFLKSVANTLGIVERDSMEHEEMAALACTLASYVHFAFDTFVRYPEVSNGAFVYVSQNQLHTPVELANILWNGYKATLTEGVRTDLPPIVIDRANVFMPPVPIMVSNLTRYYLSMDSHAIAYNDGKPNFACSFASVQNKPTTPHALCKLLKDKGYTVALGGAVHPPLPDVDAPDHGSGPADD